MNNSSWTLLHNLSAQSYGGGLYLNSGNVSLINTIVAYNTADSSDGNEYGAGIHIDDGNLTLTHSDVVHNIPEGVRNGDGLVTAVNSIFYFNQGDEIVGDASVNYSDVEGGWATGDGNIDADPLFVSPPDLHLDGASLCIDSGTDIPGLPATDFDGNPRPSGSGYDMGAYEYAQQSPAGVLQFSVENYEVSENGGSATITVTRTGGSNGAVSVDYATSDDTATAGSDYTEATGTLNWADGDATDKTFMVDIINDDEIEDEETLILSLDSPTGGAGLGTPSTATLTIMDNDSFKN
ncbi:Na-Ca exchanger/integrin-beta4 domain protein, partial [Candidatus Thiomargarita nelsonii]